MIKNQIEMEVKAGIVVVIVLKMVVVVVVEFFDSL
jgi:hypothetical protein